MVQNLVVSFGNIIHKGDYYMNNIRLKILPPWTVMIKELEALFDGDPQIAFNTDFSGSHPTVVLACNNGDKVNALC